MIGKISLSVLLLVALQMTLSADSTRVERYHYNKHHHKSTVGGFNSKRYIKPYKRPEYRLPSSSHYNASGHRRITHPHRNTHRNDYRFRHGGQDYRYRAGTFYRPHNHGYRVVSAPIGALILTLPIGCNRISYRSRDYYHYNDVYYQREREREGYRVVTNPYQNHALRYQVGTMISTLPHGATRVIIDNVQHYQYEDQYFLPRRRSGVRMYLVVDF